MSGSIGLKPLVERLGLSDRINNLDEFRLGPWDKETCKACFDTLADAYTLRCDEGVSVAVYEKLGLGIPHHIQSFFSRLREFAIMQERQIIRVDDVGYVYKNHMLGPSGQNDLAHYDTRLQEGLDGDTYRIAMEILAETATHGQFDVTARTNLQRVFSGIVEDVVRRINDALGVLAHDGYLEGSDGTYQFRSNLLRDWWATRFKGHHVALAQRGGKNLT